MCPFNAIAPQPPLSTEQPGSRDYRLLSDGLHQMQKAVRSADHDSSRAAAKARSAISVN
jgi:hypothetical protein